MSITPLMPVYPRSPVRPVRGEGAYLYGEGGEKYLDFASGIAVNILGHSHPHLTKAIQDQAAQLVHVSNMYGSPQGEHLAQRICDHSCRSAICPWKKAFSRWCGRPRPLPSGSARPAIGSADGADPMRTPFT